MSSRQSELYCAALIPYTAAAVALVLRMVARSQMKIRLDWDDYLSITAFIFGTGFTFISVFKMRWGLGRRLGDISLPNDEIVRHFFVDLWADMWLYTFSVGLSKFVILWFYWRMFKHSIIRQPIRILAGLSAIWIILRVAFILAQCQPIHKFWDKTTPGKCSIPPNVPLFVLTIPHLLIELGILVCPMVEIRRLHLPRAQKIAVALMFTSGLLVCGSALGTIVHTLKLNTASLDLTWDGIDDQIWAVCDVNLAHFSTSLPLLRPAFRRFGGFFSSIVSTSVRSTTYGNSRSKHHSHTFNHTLNHPKRNPETDSTRQLANGEDSVSDDVHGSDGNISSNVIKLHDLQPKSPDIEGRMGIFVKNEISNKMSTT